MLSRYEQILDEWISDIVKDGNDDNLFASGYLQGHFAVVLSQLEAEETVDLTLLVEKMNACLMLAKEELSGADYQLVNDAWLILLNKLKQA